MRIVVSDLLPGTDYAIQVRANDQGSTSEWSPRFELTTAEDSVLPATPTGVTWAVSGDAFYGEWNSVTTNTDGELSVVVRYEMEFSNGATTKVVSVSQNTNSKVNYTLTFEENRALFGSPKAAVGLRVRAVDNKNLKSAWSTIINASNPAPAAPTAVSATAGISQISLKWTPPADTDVIGYNIYNGATYQAFVNGTSYIYSTTTYSSTTLAVRAVDKFGQTSAAANANAVTPQSPFTTDVTPPAVPTGLAATVTNNASGVGARATVSWTGGSETDRAGFNVAYKRNADSVWSVTTVDSETTSTIIELSYANTAYDFRVRAFDGYANASNWTATLSKAAPASVAPAAVTGFAASAGRDAINYTWNASASTDLKNYEVTFSTSSTFASGNVSFYPATTALTVAGLSPETTYYARVRATNQAGQSSAWSSTLSKATQAFPETPLSDGNPPASSPTPVVSGGIGYIYASWTPVVNNDIVTYEVHLGTTSGFTPSSSTKVSEITGTATIIRQLPGTTNPLAYNTNYYVKTVAKDVDGAAAPSTASAAVQATKATSPDITLTPADIGAPTVTDLTDLEAVVDDSVKSVVTEYAVNSSETVAPTTGWSSAQPTRTAGEFIWYRIVTTYNDNTSTTSAAALLTGNTGSQGIQGPAGSDGSSLYTWLKYADTPTTGMADTPEGKTYIGLAYNKTSPTESETYGDYTWSLIKGADGDDGKGISSTVVTYQTGTSGTTAPTGSWQTTPTATTTGQYLWTKTFTTYTDSSTSTAYSVAAHGSTGSTGATGRGITGTTVDYAKSTSGTSAPTSGWTTTIPATTTGEYLWTRTTTTYSSAPTSVVSYSVAAHGATGSQGIQGPPGEDGQPTYTWIKYSANADGTGMVDEPTASTTYIGIAYNKLTQTESTTPGDYQWSLIQGPEGPQGPQGDTGAPGADGTDGADAKSVTVGNDAIAIPTTASGAATASGTITIPFAGWVGSTRAAATLTYSALPAGITLGSNTAATTSADGSLVLNYASGATIGSTASGSITLTITTGGTAFTKVFTWARAYTGAQGSTGTSATSLDVTPDVILIPTNSSGAALNAGSTVVNIKGMVGATASAVTIGAAPTLPAGVTATPSGSATTNAYITFSWASGATIGSGPGGTFTWTFTVNGISFNMNIGWARAAQGIQGSTGATGNGVSSTAVTYQVGTSGTTAPTGTWTTTIPATTTGQYLWTRTVTNYTDSTSTTAYSVAAHGSTGSTGAPGKGISSTEVKYQTHSNGTTAPTGTWSTTPTATTTGQYLWTRTILTYTDSTTSTAYSVSAHGSTGATGQTGADGAPGVGVSSTAVTYQVGSSGTTAPGGSWTTAIPATSPGQYLWTRTITTYSDNSTTTAYSVAAHGTTGADGNDGADGVGISSTLVEYQTHTSGTVAPTGTWSANPTATTTGQYLWTRTKTTFTDNSTTTAYSVSAHGATGPTGPAGADAKTVVVTATTQVLTHPATGGATSPATAVVTGSAVNTTIDKWEYSTNGAAFTTTVPTGASRSGNTVTITGGTFTGKTLTVKMSNTASGVADSITVAKVSDGATGSTGPVGPEGPTGADGTDGLDAYTILLSNEANVFPGTTSAAVAGSITTNVIALKGTTAMPIDVGTINTGVAGITAAVTSGDNTTAPVITVTVTTSLTTQAGTFDIPLTVDGKSFTKKFSWSVSYTGAQGPQGPQGDTGGSGVSVTSVVPYYKTVTPVGAAPPAKPTTSTPTGWTTTEPAYVGNTELYSTDRVGYSNGTFSYSDVSKVSAYTAATQAMESANGKNKITHSNGTPGTTANTAGDTWIQYDANNQIIGQWRGNGGTSWTAETISSQFIANLDVGKLTSGSINAATITLTSGGTISSNNFAGSSSGFKLSATGIEVKGAPLTISNVSGLQTDLDKKASSLYVQSRGMNMVSNGGGLMGSNYNFSQATFNTTDRPAGAAGSFEWPQGSSTRINDEKISVDPSKAFQFTFSARQLAAGVPGRLYGLINMYDIDGATITPLMSAINGRVVATLAAPLNPGDTTVTVTSAADISAWANSGAANTRTLAFYDYTDSNGFTYPPGTYTRNYLYDGVNGAWPAGGISGDVITLSAAYSGPAKPAGTKVGNHQSGGTYVYIAAINVLVPDDRWEVYSAPIYPSNFRHGTALINVGWLVNRNITGGTETGSRHAVGNVSLSEITASNIPEIQAAHDRWAPTGQTTIDGGKITTDTLDAIKIKAGSTFTQDLNVRSIFTLGAAGNPGVIKSYDYSVANNTGFSLSSAGLDIRAGSIRANAIATGQLTSAVITIASGGELKTSNGAVSITENGIILGAGANITSSASVSATAITAGNITANIGITSGYIQSNGFTPGGNGYRLSSTGLEIGPNGSVSAGSLKAGTVGSGVGITMAAGSSILLNGGHLRSNTYNGGTAYSSTASAGFYLGNDGLRIGSGSISASTLTAGTITGANTITLSGANAKIVGGSWELSGDGLTIPDGAISASKLNIQSGKNLMPAEWASLEYSASAYANRSDVGGATSTIDSSEAKFGTQSLKFVAPDGATSHVFLRSGSGNGSDTMYLEPSKTYIVSWYAKLAAGSNNATQRFTYRSFNSDMSSYVTEYGSPSHDVSSTNWVRYASTITVPASTTGYGYFFVSVTSSPASTSYIDGIQVEEKISNSTTPSAWMMPGATSIDGSMIRTGEIRSTNPAVMTIVYPVYDDNGEFSYYGSPTDVTDVTQPAWSISTGGAAVFSDLAIGGRTVVGGVNDDDALLYDITIYGNTTSGSTTVTAGTSGEDRFVPDDVGKSISGPGIPANTEISTVNSDGSIVMSLAATATASNVAITTKRQAQRVSSISSANYVPEQFGWSIRSDGYAEFRDLAVDSVSTKAIRQGAIEAGNLAPEIKLESTLNLGDKITISSEGIIISNDFGETRFPTDGSDSVISGALVAKSLEIEGNFIMRGANNEIGKGTDLTIQRGTTPPKSGPSVTNQYKTRTIHGGFNPRGLIKHPGLNRYYHTESFMSGGITTTFKDANDDFAFAWANWSFNGSPQTPAKGWPVTSAMGGITELGGYFYILCDTDDPIPGTYTGYMKVYKLKYNPGAEAAESFTVVNASNAATTNHLFTYEENGGYGGISPYKPIIGSDGTYLMIAQANASGVWKVFRYNANGVKASTFSPKSHTGGNFVAKRHATGILFDKAGVDGTNRYWLATDGANYVYCFDADASRLMQHEFPGPFNANTIKGLMWDESEGRMISRTNEQACYYSKITNTNLDTSPLNVVQTWRRPNLGYETTASPKTSTTSIRRRAWVNIKSNSNIPYNNADPTSPNSVGFFITRGADTNYRRLPNPAVLDDRILLDTLPTGGATDLPSSTNFGSESPAALLSAENAGGRPVWKLSGNGVGNVGPYEWDSSGRSLSEPSLLMNTPQRQGANDQSFPSGDTYLRWTGYNGTDPTGTILNNNIGTSQDGRITFTRTGIYHFDVSVTFSSSSAGTYRSVEVRRSGGNVFGYDNTAPVSAGGASVKCSGYVRIESGDYLTVMVSHNVSGGTSVYSNTPGANHFQIKRIADL